MSADLAVKKNSMSFVTILYQYHFNFMGGGQKDHLLKYFERKCKNTDISNIVKKKNIYIQYICIYIENYEYFSYISKPCLSEQLQMQDEKPVWK